MSCPLCNHILYTLSSETALGTKIKVDRCGNCGGIWFDAFELSSIPFYEVNKLAKMSISIRSMSHKKLERKQTSADLHCPKDNHTLEILQSEIKPVGVDSHECPHCHGIWASQKELFTIAHEEQIAFERGDEKVMPTTPSITLASAIAAAFLMLASFVTILSLSIVNENRIKAEELITQRYELPVAPEAVLVVFDTLQPMKASISYGPSILEITSTQEELFPTTSHKLLLGNLKKGSIYTYTITLKDESGKTFTTPRYSFIP
jgi:Zn-finger nucleic acid-binding protein